MDEFMNYLHENAEKMNSELYKEINEKMLDVNNEMEELKGQNKLYLVKLLRFEYFGVVDGHSKHGGDESDDPDDILAHSSEEMHIILPENRIIKNYDYEDNNNKFDLEECRKNIGQSVKFEYRREWDDVRRPRLLYGIHGMAGYNYGNDDREVYFTIPYVPYRLMGISPMKSGDVEKSIVRPPRRAPD